MCLQTKGICRKWCINLLVMLVVCGGDQRPQVYTQLQVPEGEELETSDGFIVLRLLLQKTRRSLDIPFVILPASMLVIIEFHIAHVRPAIFCGNNMRDGENMPLLVHTERGTPLSSGNVKKTFQKFMEIYEPDLARIALMNLYLCLNQNPNALALTRTRARDGPQKWRTGKRTMPWIDR